MSRSLGSEKVEVEILGQSGNRSQMHKYSIYQFQERLVCIQNAYSFSEDAVGLQSYKNKEN